MPSGVYKRKPFLLKTRKKMSIAKIGNKHCLGKTSFWKNKKNPTITGNKNWNWKGGSKYLKYNRIHTWIAQKLSKPKYCEHCKRTDRKVYDWSNKYHTYKRKIEDWQRLCRSCHIKYDFRFKK